MRRRRLWVGAGIALYGFAYFVVHDIFIHQRFSLFKRTQNVYLMAIRKAHKVHHKHLGKEDGECFGMLFVPLKYFKEARQAPSKTNAAIHERVDLPVGELCRDFHSFRGEL